MAAKQNLISVLTDILVENAADAEVSSAVQRARGKRNTRLGISTPTPPAPPPAPPARRRG